MRRPLVVTVVILATVLGSVAQAGTKASGAAQPFALAVIGDVPYSAAQLKAFPGWVRRINAAPQVGVAVHLGDIKNGESRCADAYYTRIARLFAGFDDPFVYTPGDNEWTDCHRPEDGGYNPLERLGHVRATFFAHPGRTLGRHAKPVAAQAHYPENVRWTQAQVVFSTLHVVGSDNSLEPWTGKVDPTAAQRAEVRARIAADLAWLDAAFDTARAHDALGVVLMMQADTFGGREHLPGFAAIVTRIQQRAAAFERPVLLLQGDSHVFTQDHPLPGAPNVTRIVVEGADTAFEWLRVTIDPQRRRLFAWQRIAFH
jgi:hypothetical protein